jgi:putative transposase
MPYPSDLTDEQWELLEPLLRRPGKRGPRHGEDLRRVVDGMMYVTQTGCQWRYLPAEFGPWTRVWSQFRRWSRNGTWTAVLTELHRHARLEAGRSEDLPSMIVVDSHLARGGSRGGVTFHDKGGPYGRTNGAKRVVAVDVTGLPLAGVVVPASTSENTCVELVLEQLRASGQDTRLELVLVDRGVSVRAAARLSRRFGVEVRRVGWDTPQLDDQGRKVFRPIAHTWRVEVAHGTLGWSRRLAKSFENSTASASGWLQLAAVRAVLAGPR